MIIISLDKRWSQESNWNLILDMKNMKGKKWLVRFIGLLLIKIDIRNLPGKMVEYFRIDGTEEDKEIGIYLCGLFSRLWSREIDLIFNGEYVLCTANEELYAKGNQGREIGIEGVDNYLYFVRRKVCKLIVKGLHPKVGEAF